jgi:hypothetical protein
VQASARLAGAPASDVYPYPQPQPSGNTAENYEVTQYQASIETTHLDDTCGKIAALKTREDVIFDNATKQMHGCSYSFKVKLASADEILNIIKGLDPKDLTDNTYTIKQTLDAYNNEVDILTNKRDAIEATLTKALSAYDDITKLATQTQNADVLANVINSKVSIIERLTQEKIDINNQLDQIAQQKSDQMDQLNYKSFSVNIYENKYIDWQGIGDAWKAAVQNFFSSLNGFLMQMTLGFALFLFSVASYVLYALVILLIVKYAWKYGKVIWFS